MISACILEYIKALGPVLALLIGPYIAMRIYYRQKEYETTKQRYLEGCLDVIAGHLQTTLGAVSHNYARCLWLCKAFRDYGEEFDLVELGRGFRDPDNSQFNQTAHYRLRTLIKSEVIWSFYQSALAYAAGANSTFGREIPDTLRVLAKRKDVNQNREQIVGDIVKDLQKLHERSFLYASLQAEINTLATTLERERLGTAEINAFSGRPEVQQAIIRLQAASDSVAENEASSATSPQM